MNKGSQIRNLPSIRRPSPDDVARIAASPLFDAPWYLLRFPDVAMTGLAPAEHYLWLGAPLLRDPSPGFSTRYYLETNEDVARAGVNPLLHYLRSGRSEGRRPHPSVPGGPDLPRAALASTLGPEPWISRSRRSRLLAAMSEAAGTAPKEYPDPCAIAIADEILAAAPRQRVSVVMPTWNRADVVGPALRSALGQSLAPHEILLIDDGSTDGTLDRIRRDFAAEVQSGRIKLLVSEHRGVSAARNIGLAAAEGDLIAYLDSDNRWRPDYLKIMAALFAECDDLACAYAGLAMNDLDNDRQYLSGRGYDRQRMIGSNFIDLNVFTHRRALYDQLGGFDENLRRLVDWDLILRFTRLYEPVYLPFVGVDYFLDGAQLGNITRTVSLDDNRDAVRSKLRCERIRRGLEPPRLAYVLWDWPALSQSFVLAELEWLVGRGIDVEVFYHVAPDRAAVVSFDIPAHKVDNHHHLAELLRERGRNVVHCHFAFPSAALLAWPACREAKIPFTVFAHAVDIFHELNVVRNRIGEVVSDPLCLRLFVHGDHHRLFLEKLGVPPEKVAYNFQAVNLEMFRSIAPRPPPRPGAPLHGAFIGRFVEKKGIATLIEAAARLAGDNVFFDVYGYGPLEEELRERVAALKLDTVKFHGTLEGRQSVCRAIEAADFLVVPSVVAENGDTEGFPTTILEAMAAGRPVVTTTVSAIPDYLDDGITAILTAPGDADDLLRGIRRLAAITPDRRAAMLRDAQRFLDARVGVDRTMQTYFDTWTENVVDIVLVTYNTPDYQDIDATREIIRRIRAYTTTPYTLSVIDNGSDPEFLAMLRETARTMPQMRLVPLGGNRFCGPASNLAFSASDSVFSIYVCSKEGFVARHGWERPLIEYLRAHADVAIGGTLCHMPKFTRGAELGAHPDFSRFRNPAFAAVHGGKAFRHVQGGVYILRRSAVQETGGFSEAVPQGNTDVEFSYFLESCGRKLEALPEIASITTKTLPRLSAVLDETITVAHPLTLESAADLDRLQRRETTRCNICGQWDGLEAEGHCGGCGSDGLERKLYQHLALNWRAHRGSKAALVGFGDALAGVLGERMFRVTRAAAPKALRDDDFALICLDHDPGAAAATALAGRLDADGLMLWPEEDPATFAALESTGFDGRHAHRTSRVLKTDWRRLCEIVRRA